MSTVRICRKYAIGNGRTENGFLGYRLIRFSNLLRWREGRISKSFYIKRILLFFEIF